MEQGCGKEEEAGGQLFPGRRGVVWEVGEGGGWGGGVEGVRDLSQEEPRQEDAP